MQVEHLLNSLNYLQVITHSFYAISFFENYPHDFIRVWDRKQQKSILHDFTGQEVTQLGNAYMKQYFVELINNQPNNAKVKETQDEDLPFTPYEEVVDDVQVPQLPSNISFDKSDSKYLPSLRMYEDFIQTNQLYTGEEVLPFIGESEYYRYLVPMLLKMNPDVKTEFTDKPFNTVTSRLGQLKAPKSLISEVYDRAEIS